MQFEITVQKYRARTEKNSIKKIKIDIIMIVQFPLQFLSSHYNFTRLLFHIPLTPFFVRENAVLIWYWGNNRAFV